MLMLQTRSFLICCWTTFHSQFPCRTGCRAIESTSELLFSVSRARDLLKTLFSQNATNLSENWTRVENPGDPILHCDPRGQKIGVWMSQDCVGHDAAHTSPRPGTTQSPKVRQVTVVSIIILWYFIYLFIYLAVSEVEVRLCLQTLLVAYSSQVWYLLAFALTYLEWFQTTSFSKLWSPELKRISLEISKFSPIKRLKLPRWGWNNQNRGKGETYFPKWKIRTNCNRQEPHESHC